MLRLAFAAVAGIVFCELVGYWLHVLLHSDRIRWLSRNHMIHHLKVYGPKKGLRSAGSYRSSTEGRVAIHGTGVAVTTAMTT